MNFGEKLSVKKVYTNTVRYILTHIKGYLFLTFFYFLGSCLSTLLGYNFIRLILLYLLLYFAAGLYYKQTFLTDVKIFLRASLRFLTAVVMFLMSLLFSTFCINALLEFVRSTLLGGEVGVHLIIGSVTWLLGKYAFIFLLLVVFMFIPSFAFISEISGKSRSVINAYAKTKGNVIRIALIISLACISMLLVIAVFAYTNPFISNLAYSAALVFNTIIYFKMYDFFYNIPQAKRIKKAKEDKEKPETKAKEAVIKETEEEKTNAD